MTALYLAAPFQTTYSITTNCAHLIASLHLKYGKYICSSTAQAAYLIRVVKENDSYMIVTPQKTIETCNPLQKIDDIIFENTRYNEQIFALHGATVEYAGMAYLFLASTSSGKTTLASYLTSNGFGYITDDCILLDRTSFRIYPYTSPIHLRDGGLEILKKYHMNPENLTLLDTPSFRRYIYLPANCILTDVPLGKIFFISRTDCENRIADMSTNEKIAALMKSPITNYALTSEYLRFLSMLAKTTCCQLFYSDMDYVAEVIRNG